MLYDGKCLFCQKAISIVKSLDWLGMIQPKDVFSFSEEDIKKLVQSTRSGGALNQVEGLVPGRVEGLLKYRSSTSIKVSKFNFDFDRLNFTHYFAMANFCATLHHN